MDISKQAHGDLFLQKWSIHTAAAFAVGWGGTWGSECCDFILFCLILCWAEKCYLTLMQHSMTDAAVVFSPFRGLSFIEDGV